MAWPMRAWRHHVGCLFNACMAMRNHRMFLLCPGGVNASAIVVFCRSSYIIATTCGFEPKKLRNLLTLTDRFALFVLRFLCPTSLRPILIDSLVECTSISASSSSCILSVIYYFRCACLLVCSHALKFALRRFLITRYCCKNSIGNNCWEEMRLVNLF